MELKRRQIKDERGIKALKPLPPPGKGATKETKAATAAVRKLAAAYGHPVASVVGSGGGSSQTRDRLTSSLGSCDDRCLSGLSPD